jgi:hypothetical protein
MPPMAGVALKMLRRERSADRIAWPRRASDPFPPVTWQSVATRLDYAKRTVPENDLGR